MHVHFEGHHAFVLRLAIGGLLLPQERSSEFPFPPGSSAFAKATADKAIRGNCFLQRAVDRCGFTVKGSA
jgi:hypothetical protein